MRKIFEDFSDLIVEIVMFSVIISAVIKIVMRAIG